MIKRIAVVILCCYLFSSTELSELAKLPVLIGHYLDHKEKQNDLTLWGFLCLHYANGNVRDADFEKDMKLPFKTCACQGHGEKPVRTEAGTILVPQDNGTEFLHARAGYYRFSETSALKGGIWQPPKSC